MLLEILIRLTVWGLSLNNEALLRESENGDGGKIVIVVGGGVAGLTAAAKLHNAGFNVTLFEAMDRIGGRIHTVRLGNGHYTELGAEWIHGEKGNIVFDLASAMGLITPTDTHEFELLQQFGFQTGELLNSNVGVKIQELLENMWYDPHNWGSDVKGNNVSMGVFSRVILNKFNEVNHLHSDPVFLEAVYDWTHRATNAEDSTDNWFLKSNTDEGEQFEAVYGADRTWKPPYSYSSLNQIILTGNVTADGEYQLPEWIKLNTEVISVQYSPNMNLVNVVTTDGSRFSADHVVFTPSLGVLKAKHSTIFSPALSLRKQLAIENIGFGTVSKLALEYESPWWPQEWKGLFPLWTDHDYTNSSLEYWRENITKEDLLTEHDGIPLWCRSIISFFTVTSAPNVLRVWVSGPPSRIMDDLDSVYLQNQATKVLHLFLDKTFPNITEPVRSFKSTWWSNPYTRGTYSFRSLTSEALRVWPSDLAKPILQFETGKPLICFAGEATNSHHFATVHGAYETGVREFERIQSFHMRRSGSSETNRTRI